MKVEDGYYIDDFWHEMLPYIFMHSASWQHCYACINVSVNKATKITD